MLNSPFIKSLPCNQRRLFFNLHYCDEKTLFGVTIHNVLKSNNLSQWNDLIALLKEQSDQGGSANEEVIKAIGIDCYNILKTV